MGGEREREREREREKEKGRGECFDQQKHMATFQGERREDIKREKKRHRETEREIYRKAKKESVFLFHIHRAF